MKGFPCQRNVVATSVLAAFLLGGVLLPADATILKGGISQNMTAEPVQPGIVGIDFLIPPEAVPVIRAVFEGTPAARAGLQPGDQVLAINTRATHGLSRQEVDEAISDVPGDMVAFVVQRQGRVLTVRVVVASLDSLEASPVRSLYRGMFEN